MLCRLRSSSEFLRRRAPYSPFEEPRRFRHHLRDGQIYLKYDVTVSPTTRVLDHMPEVVEIQCDLDNLLSLLLTPASNPEHVARQFQVGCVVAGGAEWSCRPNRRASFTRRVLAVVASNRNGSRIDLSTSDCHPFEAFESHHIEVWSHPNVASFTSQQSRARRSSATTSRSISTRNLPVDSDQQAYSLYQEHDEIFLVDSEQSRLSFEYDIDMRYSFRFKIRAEMSASGHSVLHELESWIDERVVISVLARANSTTASFQDYRRILHSGVELFTLQLSVGGVGMELGLFGDLAMQMQFSGDNHFSGNVGCVVSRHAKYGCQWDPNTETFAAINEGGDVGANKTLDWENKVVGIVNTVMEFSSALRLGSGLLYWPGTPISQKHYSLNPKPEILNSNP
jgi:hypothetical protein